MTSILAAGGLVAAAAAGRFYEDVGTRLRRECESILQQAPPPSGSDPERLVKACIMTRAGLR